MRIVFAGTPAVSIPALSALLGSSHEVVGVLTRPPARQGRSKRLIDSPVAAWAKEQGLDVLETSKPGEASALAWLQASGAQLGVIVAYGSLLKRPVLDVFAHGWINLHFSALPKLRGAAPVQTAILEQHGDIGTTVFQLDEGMDSGPILSIEDHYLDPTWTSGEALDHLALGSSAQLVSAVDAIADGSAHFRPQDVGPDDINVTVAPKLERKDGFIDFASEPGPTAARTRAVTPTPGAWTSLGGQVMKLGPVTVVDIDRSLDPGEIYAEKNRVLVGCSGGVVQLGQVAPAGKSWMDAAAWARGARLAPGQRLGTSE